MSAIRVASLSKSYRIGAQAGYRTLRETIHDLFRRREPGDVLWALRDVSFEVAKGDVVGIVGRNGAGKSTLLKVIARITSPTAGRVELAGRTGSLLEVGTGFHPELTGRENIFLNGVILGMKRAEIARKFDEIVVFADLERFLDTPVKWYSSGMYLRLAFSVAAHLETEILLADEVLAVGDAAFQKKCLGKMSDVARAGRTVLFVSHNMAAIENLCRRALWLEAGRLRMEGASRDVLAAYAATVNERKEADLSARTDRRGTGDVVFTRIALDDRPDGVTVRLGYRAKRRAPSSHVWVDIRTQLGTVIAGFASTDVSCYPTLEGEGTIEVAIEPMNLLPGKYLLSAYVSDGQTIFDEVEAIGTLEVPARDVHGTGASLEQSYRGLVYWKARWTCT